MHDVFKRNNQMPCLDSCHAKNLNNLSQIANIIPEVIIMEQKTQKQIQEQKNHNKFNNITQKVTPENQNQTHNSRKEGTLPINQNR